MVPTIIVHPRCHSVQIGIFQKIRPIGRNDQFLKSPLSRVGTSRQSRKSLQFAPLSSSSGEFPLNCIYRTIPALHELDCEDAGFEWLVMHDADRGVFAWLRKGRQTHERCLVVVNFTPELYRDYRIKVPFSGMWREILNSDSALYGGSNIGNEGAVRTLHEGTVPEVSLVVPPLAAIFLVPER